ncbi:MAG TPA: hypothetical protein VE954_22885 [Oligoflexus sp.]|uniref:hypothetical protein n=1 Tax=Oligoflexus sp. TaxID=1971216 RepID=UPI002D2469D2|nr:hypothetical protein [Oligoflexus sp.]HYX35957.1 hypothetical protein [Oligoflexus sp.]
MGGAVHNHGQDPVNALLQAALWDNFPSEGFSSRPFWLWLTQSDKADRRLREFAQKRIKQIDRKQVGTATPWQIFEVGRFPEVTWSMKFTSSPSGYFSIQPKPAFPLACADDAGILVPTSTWFHKIAIRHSHDYHPLVNVKSWIRLPIGLVYGITTVATGASLVVGGCALDIAAKGDRALCKISIQGGTVLISKSDDVVDSALSPDLRHWEHLPAALYLRLGESGSGPCFKRATDIGLQRVL